MFACKRCTYSLDKFEEFDKTTHELTCSECGETDLYEDTKELHDKSGELFTIDDFVILCEDGIFNDCNGFGYLAMEDYESNRFVKSSYVKEKTFSTCYTHVMWYNR